MTQPNSPELAPIPTNPEVSSLKASPSSQPDASTPPLPSTDDLTSLSELPNSPESTTEDDSQSEFPQRGFPAQWTVPTSGELAFLASLPKATVGLDNEMSIPSNADRIPLGTEQMEERAHLADATAAQSVPAAETGEILSAASRHWSATWNGAILHRRDTWAVGERWGRHIRVIDAGDRNLGDASRKKSR